ncbi:MAG TPA: carbohydrate binding family 9 domain-containing protein, partial [Gemmatimonadaceae bacterium]|nr:carbohydrate binding family 9 domain-containing protein [Gemmatimonadaceae bacterium]
MRTVLLFVVVSSLVVAPRESRGQSADARASRQTLRAVRATEPIRLDGQFNEAAWQSAEAGSDFIQRYPTPGRAATLRTEVRVAYDDDAVYVAARMFDPRPDSIAAPLARRDPGSISSDWIDVIFDSYNDRRTAYRFGINPAGTKLDVYHFNDTDQDDSWDAIWDAATRIDSLGWTAEIRVPLSQLRFHGSAG